MKNVVVYPGSFDPIHSGHLDLIRRAATRFDRLIVALARNRAKAPMFEADERLALLRQTCRGIRGVQVDSFDGLLVSYCRRVRAQTIVRGLRAFSDFEYESGMAMANRKLAPGIETLFLMPSEPYTYLSSTIVRDVARNRGALSAMVPPAVARALRARTQREGRRG